MRIFAFTRVGDTLKLGLKNIAHASKSPVPRNQNSTCIARAASSSGFDWNLYVSVLNLEDKPLYFCSETVPVQFSSIHRTAETDLVRRFPRTTCFALTAYHCGDQQHGCGRNALDHAELERDLFSIKPSSGRVMTGFAFFPGARETFQKRFFLTSPQHHASVMEPIVADLARKYGQAAFYRYVWREEAIVQELVATVSCQTVSSFPIVSVVPAPYPPVFADPSYHSVFHGMKKTKEVLLDFQALRPDEVPPNFWRVMSSILADEGSIPPAKADHPVVVIEGLDGTGKSTLCENLSKAIPNATLLATPPKPLLQFRAAFDGYPALIRRAYYSLGNYIAAKEILSAAKTGPVIVDRYWHSSAAYAIASEVECGGKDSIPPQGHEVYRWPRDLFKPDLAVLLVVSAKMRVKRMNVRGGVKTEEEEWLESNQQFQERLLGSYERMEAPSLRRVDANGSKEEVLTAVLKVIQERLSTTVSAPSP